MLKDKVIVITGGSGLLGLEFVRAVIKNRGLAIIASRCEKTGLKTKTGLSKELNTDKIDFISTDITSPESIKNCIKQIDKKYNKIDALVNNAYPRNKNYGRNFFDVKFNDFTENLGMNLGGYFLTSQKFADYFKKQGQGNIVNIASIYGVVAPKFDIYDDNELSMPVEYAAIKSGLIHLTKYMAKYFKSMNIRVNALSPGGILNSQPKEFLDKYKDKCLNKGMLDKKDVSGTLVYLLSDMSQYVNGQNIIIDDGFCL